MLGLQPTEFWDYGLSDLCRCLPAALFPDKHRGVLHLDGIGNCLPIRSGRAAIFIAVKALNLGPQAQIGVPLYCCPVVFKAIKAAGCTLRFIDIDARTFCISPEDLSAKSTSLDAAVAVHMFGNVCDMTKLQAAMIGKPLIEDCAQSLGSKVNGQMSGSFGTIAAFSFRSGKYLSVGEGGALFSHRPELNSRISQMIVNMPAPSRSEEWRHVFLTYVRSRLRSKPLYGLAGYRLWHLYNKKTDFVRKSRIILSQAFGTDLSMVRSRLSLLNLMVETQRANAEYYLHHLQLNRSMLCSEIPGVYYNRYSFPITFPTSVNRDQIAEYLQSRYICTSKPYEEVIDGAAKYYGYAGECPVAEDILRRTLVIPTHYRLKKQDLEHIVQSINRGWTDISAHSHNKPL